MGKGRAPFYDVLAVIRGLDPEIPIHAYRNVRVPVDGDAKLALWWRYAGSILIAEDPRPEGWNEAGARGERIERAWQEAQHEKTRRIYRALAAAGYDFGSARLHDRPLMERENPYTHIMGCRFDEVGINEVTTVVHGHRKVIARVPLHDIVRIVFNGRISLNPLENFR